MSELKESWKEFSTSPLTDFHALLQDEFHNFRLEKTEKTSVELNGIEFAKIVASAKIKLNEKYSKLNLNKAIPK